MRVLNLHGLGGSGENTNSRIIRKLYPKAELVSETIDYFHTNPEDIIDKYCSDGKFDFVLGNSFGGFFAYIIGTELNVRTILTNPCIPPADYILRLVDSYDYLEELKNLWEKYHSSNSDCHVLLGDRDEVLDPKKTFNQLHGTAQHIAFISGCGHSIKEAECKEWIWYKMEGEDSWERDDGS